MGTDVNAELRCRFFAHTRQLSATANALLIQKSLERRLWDNSKCQVQMILPMKALALRVLLMTLPRIQGSSSLSDTGHGCWALIASGNYAEMITSQPSCSRDGALWVAGQAASGHWAAPGTAAEGGRRWHAAPACSPGPTAHRDNHPTQLPLRCSGRTVHAAFIRVTALLGCLLNCHALLY